MWRTFLLIFLAGCVRAKVEILHPTRVNVSIPHTPTHNGQGQGNKEPTPTTYPTRTKRSNNDTSYCRRSLTKINGEIACSGMKIFSENFEHLDPKKWQTEIQFAGEPDYEFVIYLSNKENLFLREGQLYIKPTVADEKFGTKFVNLPQGLDLGDNCTGAYGTTDCMQKPQAYIILPPIISARINTRSSFSFLYGLIEVRAKLPKGDWIYPELYLLPKKYEYGPGYDSGTILIAFLPGNRNLDQELQGGCITGSSAKARQYGIRKIQKNSSWSDDFHLFSVRWKPHVISLLVDNDVYGNIFPPPGGFASGLPEENLDAAIIQKWGQGDLFAPFDKERYITVGVGVGGHCFPDQIGVTKPYTNNDPKSQKRFYNAKSSWRPTYGYYEAADAKLVMYCFYRNHIGIFPLGGSCMRKVKETFQYDSYRTSTVRVLRYSQCEGRMHKPLHRIRTLKILKNDK